MNDLEVGRAALARFELSSGGDDALALALRCFNSAVHDAPSSGEAWLCRAQVFIALEDFDAADADVVIARRLLAEALATEATDWRSHVLLAKALTLGAQQQHDEACTHLREAARLAPTEVTVYETLGWLLQSSADREELMRVLTDGLERAGPSAELLLRRGSCHESLGCFDEARADFERGMALAPDDWRFFNRRGELFILLARRAEGAEADALWTRAGDDYEHFRRLDSGFTHSAPDFCLTEPPPKRGGLVIDLHLDDEATVSTRRLADDGQSTRQLSEDVFVEFAHALDFDHRLDWYGVTVWRCAELATLSECLERHRQQVCALKSYSAFRRHAMSTGWLAVLTRSCGDHERHWETWVASLKQVSDGLLSFVAEGRRRGLALRVCGV